MGVDYHMTHYMKLHNSPFSLIASGKKTIELRLYDEKRKLIHPGDQIVFSNTQAPENTVTVTVRELHIFPTSDELYKALPLEKCGYLPTEIPAASPKDMEAYYSPAQQAQFGVVGIEITLT